MWTRTLLATSVATALVFGASVNAATNKDDNDSVRSWGPWNGVQTAAGPGVGGAAVVPLLLQFAEDQNNRNSNAFDADVEQDLDNSGYREYVAWYSRNSHEQNKSTVRAGFINSPSVVDGGEGGRDSISYAVDTEAGDQTYQARTGFLNNNDRFVSTAAIEGKNPNKFRNKQRLELFANLDNEEQLSFFSGWWDSHTQKKVNGQWRNKTLWNDGGFIFGQSSSIDSVNDLLAGNVVALYQSRDAFSLGGSVRIIMQLGSNPSWSGNFSPEGSRNFSVNNGSFNGVDLQGSVVADSKITGGQVNASFFGGAAEHIGGIAEVQFKNPNKADFVDVFAVERVGVKELPIPVPVEAQ